MNIVLLNRQSVFITGFLIGFVTVFLTKYAGRVFESPAFHKDTSKATWSLVETWAKHSENYEDWRKNQNIRISKVDQDTLAYGPSFTQIFTSEKKKVILEAEWLKNRVPVTCVVFVEKLKLAIAIKDTWGKHCNNLLFFSHHLSDNYIPVINLGFKYTSSWQLLCEVMNYIWKKQNEISLQWLIFIRDDTIVIPENLRYVLAPLDYKEPHYLGHSVVLWGQPYNVAQAGFVLSYEVLRRLMKLFDTSEKCAAGGKYWKKEDYYLGKHLALLGIHPMDTRDSEQRGTFHASSLNSLLWGIAKLENYHTRALYPVGPECCSNRTITFNIGDPDKMRTMTYMLYQLRLFESGVYGNRPASTPIPEVEVWRSALQEEFNMTNVGEISSDKYFQIWRTKYSEPEQFIARTFQKKPEAEQSNREIRDSRIKALNKLSDN
ncbi:hypothetical protein TSAR_002966 [Trichomalopsis sarcophagae]|uniref:Uncharacterized protein n=1 Tax=Trichomalopsis sarcophagae TaxID=543379 RepID=A0A232FNA7_9HYME|nr:hypothetical protein TSAR_002966 [Trichomalopsis sarcophagae]